MTGSSDSAEDRGRRARELVASQEAFFEYYWPRLVRYLTSQASSSSLAEDIASDTMELALINWDKVRKHERPDQWLFKVATRQLRRREAQMRRESRIDEDLGSARGDLLVTAAHDRWVEDNLDVVTAVRSLPRRQCEVVALVYLLDLEIAETASILGVDEGTVKTHLHRGRENLKLILNVPAAASTTGRDK